MGSSNVESAQSRLRQAQDNLESAKRNRDSAKKNGNYKTAIKNIGVGSRKMNSYDYAVYQAQERVKECKEDLARAKRNR